MQAASFEQVIRGQSHGTEVFKECFEIRQGRDAQTQEGHAQERPQRQEGEEPQAGNRDRAVRSAAQRQKSAEEEIGRQQAQEQAEVEAQVVSGRCYESRALRPGSRLVMADRSNVACQARRPLATARSLPSASNTLVTMPLVSRPALAYIAFGLS